MFERLTIRDRFARQGNGEIAHKKCYELCRPPMSCEVCELELEMLDRLAAYEDIEKSPEEIMSSLEDYKDVSQQYANFVHEMQPLKEAQADGRLVELPCKVGDTIYRIYNGKIETYSASNVMYESLFSRFKVFTTPYMCIYWKDSFGKTVFLTREAAEKALGGAEGWPKKNCT